MKSKIVTLQFLKKHLKKDTASVISGTFNPTAYYTELISWAKNQGSVLVVVVSSDRAVSFRRGFTKTLFTARHRARFVAEQPGVDYVVISSRGAHDTRILEYVQPKTLLFQQDNPRFLEALIHEARTVRSDMPISVSPIAKPLTPQGAPLGLPPNAYASNPIAQRLIKEAQSSNGAIGKIAALLYTNERVLGCTSNDTAGNHAEELLLKQFRHENLTESDLYITIPPCPMCARAIIAAGIPRVHFLFRYGDGLGSQILKKAGVLVRHVKEQE